MIVIMESVTLLEYLAKNIEDVAKRIRFDKTKPSRVFIETLFMRMGWRLVQTGKNLRGFKFITPNGIQVEFDVFINRERGMYGRPNPDLRTSVVFHDISGSYLEDNRHDLRAQIEEVLQQANIEFNEVRTRRDVPLTITFKYKDCPWKTKI